jgi:hypothetical protein
MGRSSEVGIYRNAAFLTPTVSLLSWRPDYGVSDRIGVIPLIKPLLFAMCFFAEIFEPVPLSQALVILGMDHFMRSLTEEYT